MDSMPNAQAAAQATYLELSADVLVIGSGAAGMMAARAASDGGASVILADKSLIGRGGATVLAQMTVAVALGDAEPDTPELHTQDTLVASRGLADPAIVRTITEGGPGVIRALHDRYGTPWARTTDGRYSQVTAPGHSRPRCVYVDQLKTGEGVSASLKRAIWRDERITRLHNVLFTRLARDGDRVVGAVGVTLEQLAPVAVTAGAVVLATGGTTLVYERSSASATMSGDGMLLAAQAGAELRDMEMVQFFPIGHLYPPLVQLDPIMWDPFRYKLGGRLLNGLHEEFMSRYTQEVSGRYTATRDETTAAILAEVNAGRGSPHGGVYLDFRSVPPERLRDAFGPVIGILARQGVDLTRDMVEVAPMAHFMLGGIRVDPQMHTTVAGLFACGETIYGMHGANRLSGNAITEALVTGEIAGAVAAREPVRSDAQPLVRQTAAEEWRDLQRFWHPRAVAADEVSISALRAELQRLMTAKAGPLRREDELQQALAEIARLRRVCDEAALAPQDIFPLSLQEKVELRTMLDVSEAIVRGALARRETRGAHVRLDYPEQRVEARSQTFFYTQADGWQIADVPAAALTSPTAV